MNVLLLVLESCFGILWTASAALVPGDSLLVADLEVPAIFVVDVAADQTRRLNLSIANTSRPYDVDFDPTEGKVYWSDLTDKTIRSARMDGSDDVTLLRLDVVLFSVELALDPVKRLLFYTEYWSKNISLLSLQSGSTSLLLNTEPGYPCEVAADSKNSLLYYGVAGAGSHIGRIRYDGSEMLTFVNLSHTGCFGLTLDSSNERLYWTNPSLATVESMKVDGTARTVILQEKFQHSYNFISVLRDTIFFTDNIIAYRDRVRKISMDGQGLGVVGRRLLLTARGHHPFSLAVPLSPSTSPTTSAVTDRYDEGYSAGVGAGQRTWVGAGIGIGMAAVLFPVLVALLFLWYRRCSSRQQGKDAVLELPSATLAMADER